MQAYNQLVSAIKYKPKDRVFFPANRTRLMFSHLIEERIMPRGHASHKGTSAKPNTNTNGSIDMADDLAQSPEEILGEGVDERRAREESWKNPAATQRPNQPSK